MIQDQINLYSNRQNLRIICSLCHNSNHCIDECQYLHFYPDREKIIKTSDFPVIQERKPISRKKIKKSSFKLHKPLDFKKKLKSMFNLNHKTTELDFSSEESFEKMESEIEFNNNQINNPNEKKAMNSKIMDSEILETKAFMPLERISEYNTMYELQMSTSKINAHLSQSNFRKKSQLNKNIGTDASINLKIKSKKAMIESSNEENGDKISLVREPIEEIDKIREFKKYFQSNNFSNVILVYNKSSLKIRNTKRLALQKISYYTFYLDLMYKRMKKKRKSQNKSTKDNVKLKKHELVIGNEKIEYPISVGKRERQKQKVNPKYNFIQIVLQVIEIQKEKKNSRKYLFFSLLLKIFKKIKV